MKNVVAANVNQPREWQGPPLTAAEILEVINREAYPPKQRDGVGAVARPGI